MYMCMYMYMSQGPAGELFTKPGACKTKTTGIQRTLTNGTLHKLLATESEIFKYHSGVSELSQNVPKCPPEETLGLPKGYPKGYQKNTQKDQRDTGGVPHPTLRYGAVPKRYGAGMAHACACDATTKYDYMNRVLHQKHHFY